MRNNPFAGPAHHAALANAVERDRRAGSYMRPPPTGGEQISVRLPERLTLHLAMLAEASGWTRVQVLTALLERGMFDLYDLLSNEAGDQLMQKFVEQLPPVMHSESSLLQTAKTLAIEVAGTAAALSPAHRPEAFWVIGLPSRTGIPRMLVTIERPALEDFAAARPSDLERARPRLREQLASSWAEAESNPGREIVCGISSTILLP